MPTDEAILSLHGAALTQGKIPISILPDVQACMADMAACMVSAIEQNNQLGRPTLFIVPVGPVMQYPHFTRLVNEKGLSLRLVTFINMDEYMQDPTTPLDRDHPLSFQGFMRDHCYGAIHPNLLMPPAQRIFPTPQNADYIDQVIEAHDGVDICFGGIGINGHVAFNEPPEPGETISEADFMNLSVRLQRVSRETKVVNAMGDLAGAYDNVPDYCVTLGFKQILSARKIRLYCFRNWHKAVVRKAAFGEKSVQFPASLLQDHSDTCIVIPQELA